MADQQAGPSNAAQIEFWNSAASRAWADQHQRMDRAVAEVTKALLDLATPQPGERVLDVGCGSGTTVLELAARVGPDGYVLGADIADHSVARARERIANGQLQRRIDVALLLVATHVNVVLMRPVVGEPVDQPGVGVEVEDDRPVRGEERLELAIGQPVRMFRIRHQPEQIHHIYEPDLDVGQVLAKQGACSLLIYSASLSRRQWRARGT
jgi:hypothetical protein